MKDRPLAFGIAIVVLIAVAAGLYTTGGPDHGRQLKLDERRIAALIDLTDVLRCGSRGPAVPVLPAELTAESLAAHCPRYAHHIGPVLADHDNAEVFAFHRLSDTEFEVCTDLYSAEGLSTRPDLPAGYIRADIEMRLESRILCIAGVLPGASD